MAINSMTITTTIAITAEESWCYLDGLFQCRSEQGPSSHHRKNKSRKQPREPMMQQVQERSLSEFIKALQIQADFKCRRCGRCCCLSDPIAITIRDAERISGYLDITTEQFIERFAKRTNESDSGLSLLSQPCVFFKDGTGCTVYQARPMICRMYPPIALFVHGRLKDSKCPAMETSNELCRDVSSEDDCFYSSLLAIVEAVQAQGIPVNIERNDDGSIELKLIRYFM